MDHVKTASVLEDKVEELNHPVKVMEELLKKYIKKNMREFVDTMKRLNLEIMFIKEEYHSRVTKDISYEIIEEIFLDLDKKRPI